jgi:hypothetical protein
MTFLRPTSKSAKQQQHSFSTTALATLTLRALCPYRPWWRSVELIMLLKRQA